MDEFFLGDSLMHGLAHHGITTQENMPSVTTAFPAVNSILHGQ
jgi:hypothetical protein